MWLRVFTLGFDPVNGHFDDSAVRDFLADKEVLSINDDSGPTKIPAICFTVGPISVFCASGDSAAQTQKTLIQPT